MFDLITFYSSGSIFIQMSWFELLAMVGVLGQVWLYGRVHLLGPVVGVIAAVMWIVLASRTEPVMMGLIILNVILSIQHVWNFVKWWRQDGCPVPEPLLDDESS